MSTGWHRVKPFVPQYFCFIACAAEYNALNIYRCILPCDIFQNWMGRKALAFLWQTRKCGCCSGNHKTTYSQGGCWEITWNHLVFCLIKPAEKSEFRQSHNVQYRKNGQVTQKWCTELITAQDIRENSALEGNHRGSSYQSAEQQCLFIYSFRHLGYVIKFLMFVYFPLLVKYIIFLIRCSIFKLCYCIFTLCSPI